MKKIICTLEHIKIVIVTELYVMVHKLMDSQLMLVIMHAKNIDILLCKMVMV